MNDSDRPLRLGIDLDGVMCNFNEAFRSLIIELVGVTLPLICNTYPDTWNYHRTAGVTKDQDNKLWAHISDNTNQFWRNLGELPGAVLLRDLSDMVDARKVTVYFITNRPDAGAHQQSMAWLAAHGFRTPVVLIANDETAKGKLAAGLNLDALIDDKPENCLQVRDRAKHTRVFILDAPYNRTIAFTGITRVFSVREMLEQLQLLEVKPGPLEQAFNERQAA